MSGGDWKEMYVAAADGNFELVKYHIENGVDPNYQHPEILSTPLVAGILNGHHDVVEFLLNHGADPELVSYFDQMNAIKAAQLSKDLRMKELLKAHLPKSSSYSEKIKSFFRR